MIKLQSILFGSIIIMFLFIIDTRASDTLQINFDAHIKGSIDTIGEKDYYVFEGSSGDRILAWLTASNFAGSTLRIYAPDGSLLAENSTDQEHPTW